MEEFILNLLNGLPSAAILFYAWSTSEARHAREREEWLKELGSMRGVITGINQQITQLSFIIENYVIANGKNPAGSKNRQAGA